MPQHTTYVELFAGKSPFVAKKRPADQTILIDQDPQIVQYWTPRLSPSMSMLQGDCLELFPQLRELFNANTLIYVDPPYLRNVRTRLLYEFEFETPEQHNRLISHLESTPAMVIISGYASPLYAARLFHWRSITYTVMTRGGPRQESAWMNFAPPLRLHDPRYIGDDFRGREKINRKRRRWTARFLKMTPTERQLIQLSLEAAALATDGDTARQPAASPQIAIGSANP